MSETKQNKSLESVKIVFFSYGLIATLISLGIMFCRMAELKPIFLFTIEPIAYLSSVTFFSILVISGLIDRYFRNQP